MGAPITDQTICNICGDELGMDSGHHVSFGRDDKKLPCHWYCLEGMRTGERDAALAEVQRLREELRQATNAVADLTSYSKGVEERFGRIIDIARGSSAPGREERP